MKLITATWTEAEILAETRRLRPTSNPVSSVHDDMAAFCDGEPWFVYFDTVDSEPERLIFEPKGTDLAAATEIGTRIGQAMARDVVADGMPQEWTGLDPQDGDQLTAAGIEPGTAAWAAAETAAETEYRRCLQLAQI